MSKAVTKFVIKELSENDWRVYKAIRLRALAESPDSFGSTWEREASFTPVHWKSRLNAVSEKNSTIAVVATKNDMYIGLLSGVIQKSDSSRANLYQMWVDPTCRGLGVGTALIDEVRSWAVERDARKLLLSVTTVNIEAMSLYKSIGFVPVGSTEALRPDSTLQSQAMELLLCVGES